MLLSLRSPAEGEGHEGFPSPPEKDLESFRMDWLDLLAVQGTLKSLLQYQSLKASILRAKEEVEQCYDDLQDLLDLRLG